MSQGQDAMSHALWILAGTAFLDDSHVKELQTLQRDTILKEKMIMCWYHIIIQIELANFCRLPNLGNSIFAAVFLGPAVISKYWIA